jgi:4,5-dihydroxyphthalate decarboxylase
MPQQIEITIEALGAKPNLRYDVIQPLLQGRADVPGVKWRPTGPLVTAPFLEDPRFRDGRFGLLDINWGDAIAASDCGWNVRWLPIFHKRKPIYSYLWIRADRGIETPRDLEGKTIGTGSYRSAITVLTRGVLAHFHGVKLETLHWVANNPELLRGPRAQVRYAKDAKTPAQRLLDGEVDACTGDIVDRTLWHALETTSFVRRLFPDYEARNLSLWQTHRIFCPVHLFLMGGVLDDENPGLAREIYQGFVQAKAMAYEDALGDGPSSSLLLGSREKLQDQLQLYGDLFPYGIADNATTIEAILDYTFEQNVTTSRLNIDRLFAHGTLGS